MTAEEFRQALGTLSEEQFKQFESQWGGAGGSREAAVMAFAYTTTPEVTDRLVVYRLRGLGCAVWTELEKQYRVATETAEAAKRSASAAESSASAAREAVRRSWYPVVVAVLALVIALWDGFGCGRSPGP